MEAPFAVPPAKRRTYADAASEESTMRLRKSVRSWVFCLVAGGAAIPAVAQEVPKVELSGGYQLETFKQKWEDADTYKKGWYLDVAGNVNKMIGIVGEVGGVYRNQSESERGITVTVDSKIHQFMGGVRLSGRQNPKAVPFGQVLVGAVHPSFSAAGTGRVGNTTITIDESESENRFAVQAGGGVNVRATDKVGVRVGADYLRVFPKDNDQGVNVFRFTAGIVWLLK